MNKQPADMLGTDELAAFWKANKSKAYRLVTWGKLPVFKFGITWRLKHGDLEYAKGRK